MKSGTFSFGLSTSFNVNPETKKAEPIKLAYHVNGFAEIGTGETFTEVEVGSGEQQKLVITNAFKGMEMAP